MKVEFLNKFLLIEYKIKICYWHMNRIGGEGS